MLNKKRCYLQKKKLHRIGWLKSETVRRYTQKDAQEILVRDYESVVSKLLNLEVVMEKIETIYTLRFSTNLWKVYMKFVLSTRKLV